MEQRMEEKTKPETKVEIQERGDVFFFYRPKVNKEEARSPHDVQRLYVVLQPESGERSVEDKQLTDSGKEGSTRSEDEENKKGDGDPKEGGYGREEVNIEQQPLLCLIVMGKKGLPAPEKRGRPFWGFVELVTTKEGDIKEALKEEEYETATRSHRHKPPARALAEGVYRILRHESRRQMHTHLVYKLEFPPGDAENDSLEAFNLEREASYLILIKNPEHGDGGGRPSNSFRGLPRKRRASYPAHLQGRMGNRRFVPADPPDFLNYEWCDLLLIAASDDVEEELGLELRTECDADPDCSDLLWLVSDTVDTKPLLRGTWE